MADVWVIKTNGGLGSPGYVDDNAPNGGQWQDTFGNHLRVPEGAVVQPSTTVNANGFMEIVLLNGDKKGSKVWVKKTHVILSNLTPPPPPVGKPGYTVTGTFSMHVTPD